jgi:integrase/recombinase XerD
MKETTKLQRIVEQIIQIVRENNIRPEQFRYVTKQVRNTANLVTPKRPSRLPDYLTAGEIYYLLNVAAEDSFDALFIEFQIFTGLRISEARNLMIQDIDWFNNQLKVVQGKGGKDRHVPITSNILHKLRLYLNGRTKGYVFTKKAGLPYTIRALQIRISKRLKQCKFQKKLSTHSLRHTYACLCLARGMRIEDIKLLMGHSAIKTTEIYAKLELSSIKEKYLSLMDQRG